MSGLWMYVMPGTFCKLDSLRLILRARLPLQSNPEVTVHLVK